MDGDKVSNLASIRWHDDGPIFNAPWEAQAFAMALTLHERGVFTWQEWADTLSEEITAAQQHGDLDLGDTYYCHWLAALERLVMAKGITDANELGQRKSLWDRAVRNTPHGQPIELKNATLGAVKA